MVARHESSQGEQVPQVMCLFGEIGAVIESVRVRRGALAPLLRRQKSDAQPMEFVPRRKLSGSLATKPGEAIAVRVQTAVPFCADAVVAAWRRSAVSQAPAAPGTTSGAHPDATPEAAPSIAFAYLTSSLRPGSG